jgi:spore coat polysaccharide biosynthesis protein SpsF (cytidylyltransferase family)
LDRDDVRLVIEGEEDWEHVQEIVEALGQDNLDWRTLAELLKYQPGLRGNMARLNRAEEATAAALAR